MEVVKRIVRRSVISLPANKAEILAKQAEQKGVSLNTYCTMLLSEFAEAKESN